MPDKPGGLGMEGRPCQCCSLAI
ncbi:hypothetical protein CCUS01_17034 [Colletotrichum cuscutae]|uniref:Uncharacterized protein n=1 Tax=Colletotrichum cuscutae TaxID=1209917 RepID=A0AAI9V9H9_9PEZI|nr:hypothetical protein CCUS01_17034 [Colletotrichum cuscutae]